MIKTQDKTKFLIKWFGFSAAILMVTLLHFRQVFVLANYQPVPLSYFLKPQNFKNAIYQLTHHPVLPQLSSTSSANLNVEVDCTNTCQFVIKNIQDDTVAKTLPAIVDFDPSARLTSLELKFFDPDYQLIGYQTNAVYPVFYVINFNQDLLQVIQLNLLDNVKLEFVNYYPPAQQIHFASFNQLTQEKKDFLYSAIKPELFEVTGKI